MRFSTLYGEVYLSSMTIYKYHFSLQSEMTRLPSNQPLKNVGQMPNVACMCFFVFLIYLIYDKLLISQAAVA